MYDLFDVSWTGQWHSPRLTTITNILAYADDHGYSAVRVVGGYNLYRGGVLQAVAR